MCKTIKLKFACEHTSHNRLSTCLGHYTKTSVKSPGKVSTLCKAWKGKGALKLKVSSRCPSCIRNIHKHEHETTLDTVFSYSADNWDSLDEENREEIINLKENAQRRFDDFMLDLDTHTPAARRKVIEKPKVREHSGGKEEDKQAEREKLQRKADVIAQWNQRHAQATGRHSDSRQSPDDGKCECEPASSKSTPLTQPQRAEEAIATLPKLVLRLTQPKKKEEAPERKRKRGVTESMEPLCAGSEVCSPSEMLSPRPFKERRNALARTVRVT